MDGAFLDHVGGIPTAVRAPGFPVFAALILRLFGSPAVLAFSLVLVSTVTVYLVYCIGRNWRDEKTGLLAAALMALNLTAIANAPMLLSDTLFGLFAAFQLNLLVLAWKRKNLKFFCGAVACGAVGALIRPINSLWLFPALVVLVFLPGIAWRKKGMAALISIVLWGGILLPWMARNAAIGSGFCIDANTGSMYHQNGAMILAEVNGSEYEEEKQKILRDLEAEFADTARYSDIRSQSEYRQRQYRELVLRHWFVALRQQLQWRILLPDAPTFFENLGLTRSDRGTLNVLQRDGLWAAVQFYFDGRLWLPLLLLPFLGVTLFCYAGSGLTILFQLCRFREHTVELLLFLSCCEYYLFLPGAITAPRYQIPALPVLTVLAAIAWFSGKKYFRERRSRGSATETKSSSGA